MAAINSKIALAIAVKLRKIFEKDEKFLSFPIGSIGFTYRMLDFMKDVQSSGLSAVEQLNYKAEFSRVLNIIPEDNPRFSQDASRFLWDELIAILNDSGFAESALKPEEEKLLQEAINYLTVTSDGIAVNSQALNDYYRYKMIFDQAEAVYLDEKISVQYSTGEEGVKLKKQWELYREKQLLDSVKNAEDNWINLGNREKVRSYQEIRNDLEPKKFLILYKQAYLSDIKVSQFTDLEGQGIGAYTTFFNPSDVFNPTTAWIRINLTREEIAALCKEASADLTEIFAGDQDENVETVSLEYNNILLVRPWFKPEFFQSRYWKLSSLAQVSNGNKPTSGLIPSYISNMIVIRNIEITRKKEVAQQPFTFPMVTVGPLREFKIQQRRKNALAEIIIPKDQPLATRKGVMAARLLSPQKMMSVSPSLALSKNTSVFPPKRFFEIEATRYKGNSISTASFNTPPKQPDLSNVELETENFALDGVMVLAYLCTRVPKCPNPDLTLAWA